MPMCTPKAFRQDGSDSAIPLATAIFMHECLRLAQPDQCGLRVAAFRPMRSLEAVAMQNPSAGDFLT